MGVGKVFPQPVGGRSLVVVAAAAAGVVGVKCTETPSKAFKVLDSHQKR